jgi:GAF domain-containing protein
MEEGGAKSASAAEDSQAEQDRRALHLMLEYVCTATRADGCAVTLNQGGARAMQASVGETPPDSAPHPAAAMREECLRTGAVVDCVDTASDALGIVDAEACGRMRIGALVAAPVCVGGRTVGVLEMHSAQAYNFMGDDVDVLKRVADVIGALICRKGQ